MLFTTGPDFDTSSNAGYGIIDAATGHVMMKVPTIPADLFARRANLRLYFLGTLGLAVLVLVQMGIGDIQYRTHLPWGLVLVHVALAAAVWAGAVAVAALLFRPPASFARSRA